MILLLTACLWISNSDHEDRKATAPKDTDSSILPDDSLSRSEFWRQFAEAYCELVDRCADDSSEDSGDGQWSMSECVDSIEGGDPSTNDCQYDARAAAKCVTALNDASCADYRHGDVNFSCYQEAFNCEDDGHDTADTGCRASKSRQRAVRRWTARPR